MPILNYTTKVAATRTVSEIQAILSKKGAQRVSIDYNEQGDPLAVEFMIQHKGQPVYFRLPANIEGVYRSMNSAKNVTRRSKTKQQAARVAWRIIKDWIEAQLALVESYQAELAEVFFPYSLEEPHSKRTAFQAFEQNKERRELAAGVEMKAIGAGGE